MRERRDEFLSDEDLDLENLSAEELRGLTETVSKIAIVGERYTGTQAQQTNR